MYYRNCPKCGEQISYSRIYEKKRAEKRNTNCRLCVMGSEEVRKKISKSMMGDKNPAKRSEVRKKIGKANKGKKRSEEVQKKLRESKLGKNNYMYGRFGENNPNFGSKRSEETRRRMRLSRIKNIEKNNGQMSPNYNPKAIPIIRAKAKELGITDLRDAENGGEFQVCGYFVDGFSKEKNIVIEYNESYHKYQTERDERRKKEIIKELGCIFIVIKE